MPQKASGSIQGVTGRLKKVWEGTWISYSFDFVSKQRGVGQVFVCWILLKQSVKCCAHCTSDCISSGHYQSNNI